MILEVISPERKTITKLTDIVIKPSFRVPRDISASFFFTNNQAEIPAINAPAVNAGANTSTTKDNSGGVENTKAPEVPKPINYKITANPKGDGFTGNVYADGKLIVEQSYWSGFAYFYNGKEMEGLEAVKESLKGKAKSQGFYVDGKFYDASENVS